MFPQHQHLSPVTQTNKFNNMFVCYMEETQPSLGDLCVCVHAKSPQSCTTLCDPMDCSLPGSSVMGFLRQEYWSGCHALLQGIFLTQGWNLGLLHCRQTLYCLRHQEHTLQRIMWGEIYGIHNLDSVRLNTHIQTLPIDNTEER